MIDPCWDFGDDSGAWDDPDIAAGIDSDAFGPGEANHLSPNF